MKYLPILIVVTFLSSCANQLQLGVDAYNRGDYDVAAGYWNPLAQQGNQYAEYNLGLIWEFGLIRFDTRNEWV